MLVCVPATDFFVSLVVQPARRLYQIVRVALRAPERRVARSASPDLSDRALIRAAE
jgi:hypothetical protein